MPALVPALGGGKNGVVDPVQWPIPSGGCGECGRVEGGWAGEGRRGEGRRRSPHIPYHTSLATDAELLIYTTNTYRNAVSNTTGM